MNNRSIVNLFAIAVLVVPADSGMAQKPIPKEKAQTEEKSKAIVLPSFAQDPIEVTADTLSLGYRGHSCNEIAKRLKAINPTKDEFETTDAYVKRIEGISSLPFYGNVTAADTLAFLHSEGSMFPKYDADLGLMRIDASFMGQQILTKPTIRTLKAEVINHNVSRRDTYQASNSYGKTVTVTKTVYEVCAVVFDNKNVRDRSSLTMKVSFPLPPEEAKAAKDNLSILYVGKLVAPYYTEYGQFIKPTIDSPIEILSTGDGLIMKLLQIWVFDKTSGKVFAKVDQ